jgi:hypothetical protein
MAQLYHELYDERPDPSHRITPLAGLVTFRSLLSGWPEPAS